MQQNTMVDILEKFEIFYEIEYRIYIVFLIVIYSI